MEPELKVQGHSTDNIWSMEEEDGSIGLRFDSGDSGTLHITKKQAVYLMRTLLSHFE